MKRISLGPNSMQLISLYNKTKMNQWDEFVESHPNGTPYHLSCWLRTIHETYSFEPLLYVIKKDDGSISGILPFFRIKNWSSGRRLVSLPFSDYGGPLFLDQNDEVELLKKIIHESCRAVKHIEIRSKITEGSDFIIFNYYKRHVLDLDQDLTSIKNKIDKRTIQYSIRKAERSGVEIKEANNQLAMNEFYRLNMLTRKKHGVPAQSKIFFNKLFNNVISKGHGFILLADYKSKIVASSIFLKLNNSIHFKYNASDPIYLKKVTPNHSLIWEAVKKGLEKGFKLIEFGRTSPDNEGLMRYKKMWGSAELDMPYSFFPKIKGANATKEKSNIYRGLTSIWRSLPNPIIEKIGPMIYKHTA